MKTLWMLYLGCFPALAQATVTGPISCMETTGNDGSQAAVLTLTDDSGKTLLLHYSWNNIAVTTDGAFAYGDMIFYCGLPLASGLLTYCQNNNL